MMTELSPFIRAGWPELLAALLLFLLLHEAAHYLVLRLMGFAAGLQLRGCLGIAMRADLACQGWREALAAAAGPGVNLLLMWFCLKFGWQAGAQVKFGLAAGNMLPFLPLDGGKILRGLTAGLFGWKAVSKLLLFWARAAALCFALCIYYFGLKKLLLLLALWLYLLAWREERNLSYQLVSALNQTVGQSLRPRRLVRINQDMPVFRAVRRFSPGWCNWLLYRGRLLDGDVLIEHMAAGGGGDCISCLVGRKLPIN